MSAVSDPRPAGRWGFRLRGREVTRLEAFSDAVFGFAATLLVVSLEVPRTLSELLASLGGFVAFAFSFAALVLIWAVHNSFFRRYGLQDAATVAINSVLLFVVLFFVYPLKFLTVSFAVNVLGIGGGASQTVLRNMGELGTLFVVYGSGFVAVFFCVALLFFHAWRRRQELDLDRVEQHEALMWCRHYLIFVAVGLLSVALAWAGVGLSFGFPGLIYFLLGPLCAAHGVWSGRRRERLERVAGLTAEP